ncbi:MAG: YaiO family outer membrane beta-barrel protein [Polyangiaceae bacterium]|nr:YaiO family outer membrane beta-barrel protein [Polyangiaceae bacterium]
MSWRGLLPVMVVCFPANTRAAEAPPPIPLEGNSTSGPIEEAEPAAKEGPPVFDFKASTGPFYGHFSDGQGDWFGLHSRFWVLDVTGKRRWSGYLDIVDMGWQPDSSNADELSDTRADFFVGRALRYWNDNFYTFLTLGGTVGDAIFPRGMAEVEANYLIPSARGLVVTFGGGYRQYEPANRPYVVLGGAYSLPRAALLYRYYTGASIARRRSDTHLMTFVWGERLKFWLRADFLWGDESHPSPNVPSGLQLDSRSISVTWEQWLMDDTGTSLQLGVAEAAITGRDTPTTFHRFGGELRGFITF